MQTFFYSRGSFAESIECIIEDQAFSPLCDLSPSPSPVSKLDRRHTQEDRMRVNFLTREGGGEGVGAKS